MFCEHFRKLVGSLSSLRSNSSFLSEGSGGALAMKDVWKIEGDEVSGGTQQLCLEFACSLAVPFPSTADRLGP